MGVRKTYTEAEVKSAIEQASQHYYRHFLRVRSDVTDAQYASPKIKVERDASGAPKNPYAWRGRGSDVGHVFRHVDGTASAGKSIWTHGVVAISPQMASRPCKAALCAFLAARFHKSILNFFPRTVDKEAAALRVLDLTT